MAYSPHSVGSHRMPRQTQAPWAKIRTPRSSAKRSSSMLRRSSVSRKTPSRSLITKTRPRWTISLEMGLPASPIGSPTPNRWGGGAAVVKDPDHGVAPPGRTQGADDLPVRLHQGLHVGHVPGGGDRRPVAPLVHGVAQGRLVAHRAVPVDDPARPAGG